MVDLSRFVLIGDTEDERRSQIRQVRRDLFRRWDAELPHPEEQSRDLCLTELSPLLELGTESLKLYPDTRPKNLVILTSDGHALSLSDRPATPGEAQKFRMDGKVSRLEKVLWCSDWGRVRTLASDCCSLNIHVSFILAILSPSEAPAHLHAFEQLSLFAHRTGGEVYFDSAPRMAEIAALGVLLPPDPDPDSLINLTHADRRTSIEPSITALERLLSQTEMSTEDQSCPYAQDLPGRRALPSPLGLDPESQRLSTNDPSLLGSPGKHNRFFNSPMDQEQGWPIRQLRSRKTHRLKLCSRLLSPGPASLASILRLLGTDGFRIVRAMPLQADDPDSPRVRIWFLYRWSPRVSIEYVLTATVSSPPLSSSKLGLAEAEVCLWCSLLQKHKLQCSHSLPHCCFILLPPRY